MKKILGITCLLVAIVAFTASRSGESYSPGNLFNNARWTAIFAIIGIGASFVIITGGIDLSIGSVFGLTGCVLAMWLEMTAEKPVSLLVSWTLLVVGLQGFVAGLLWLAVLLWRRLRRRGPADEKSKSIAYCVTLLAGSGAALAAWGFLPSFSLPREVTIFLVVILSLGMALEIGLIHGLLITKLRLQPFVVTLCGLLIYRGLARYVTNDMSQGFSDDLGALIYLAKGKPFDIPVPRIGDVSVPMPFLIMVGIAIAASIFLNLTVHGRHLLALGRNEQAARFSGINTDRLVIVAYVVCSGLAGFAGILNGLDIKSLQPSAQGSTYELYAIAAAVLGGCSLRGGEGTVLGVVIGAAVMRVLNNSINLLGIPTQLEYTVIGIVILLGVIADELAKRFAARKIR